jgi:hypothetical protein
MINGKMTKTESYPNVSLSLILANYLSSNNEGAESRLIGLKVKRLKPAESYLSAQFLC